MKLIGSLTSPYVRKVRIVMAEKKLDYRLELEDVWAADSKITTSNPLAKVPCLIMEDGGAVFDSRVIVEYVDTLSPVGKLIPGTGRERAEVKTWEALADGICDAAILVRLEKTGAFRKDSERCQAWIDRQMAKVTEGLRAASAALDERAWCVGNTCTLADISIGVALGYLDFRFPEIAWKAEYANLAAHAEKLNKRPSFIDTAPPQS
ncbi:glutathione S-transferase N-terminal domain-containing protein [Piscinibacterium candidicorallinum]|jgi:glutathione S-transferase|uniref:Glutathione S-transferase N-terminal domain-containing protein n=1 Tax=Piscinibacterium candidicorallinum TaxID=1793872 RepID=A0ABV7H3X4_9BURK